MKTATIQEIKLELKNEQPTRLLELCLRLARFKKENKELLTFLLFEAHDIEAYINSVKLEIDTQFDSINTSNVYFIKKTLRKVLRITNKFIRYSGSDLVATELLIHFCTKMKDADFSHLTNPVLNNIYLNQIKKINKTISSMHEDLQYDYLKKVQQLSF